MARTSKNAKAPQKRTNARRATAATRTKKKTNAPKTAGPKKTRALAAIERNPLGHLVIEQHLFEEGFRGTIATDEETRRAYSTDESIFSITPQTVLQPKDAHDVEIAVSVLSADVEKFPAVSLTPRAAGTGLSGGSLTDSIVIDVCAYMTKIRPLSQTKRAATITCEPGAMWRDVEAILKEDGYYLPPYPASKDICTIGGAVGNNSAGPDSFRHGHVADWVESLDVTLADGNTYTVTALSYRELSKLIKQKHAYAQIAKEIFALIEANETAIDRARPNTPKNTAGYALWDVLNVSVAEFKRGIGTFDLTRLITGSQGTLGIVTSITMRVAPIHENTKLIVVPIFDLARAGGLVTTARSYNPINIEVFDDLTYDLAMQNPGFFRSRLTNAEYYKTLFALYSTYHVRYRKKLPTLTFLITLDGDTQTDERVAQILDNLQRTQTPAARLVKNPFEVEMYWQMRRASYSLSKLQDPSKRPAAFLEDMIVPPENLAPFFAEIKRLFKKYNITAAVHGHGGDGHFHFYPLLDFTRKSTPQLIEKMADEFYDVALRHDGGICGEHNDGIIRTPHTAKMFSKNVHSLFQETEHLFDPHDIFNPGKKVNPRFTITDVIRTTN